MPFSLISTVTASNTGDSITTGAIDTTGANLIVVSFFGAERWPTVTDSKGNVYTVSPARRNGADGIWVFFYHCHSPTVGSGHTFTVASSAQYASVVVTAFSGAKATGAFRSESGNTSGAQNTSLAGGTVTTAVDGALVLSIMGIHSTTTTLPTVDTGFTVAASRAIGGGSVYGGIVAYLEKATAGAVSPTWSSGTASLSATTIADFDPPVATVSFVPDSRPRSFHPLLAQ